jgi:hypothetical protein
MRTKKSTDEFFWNISSSLGMEQHVSFNDGLTMAGGDRDWLGIDDGHRQPSEALKQATASSSSSR